MARVYRLDNRTGRTEYKRQWYLDHKEEQLARVRTHHREHPEIQAAASARYYERRKLKRLAAHGGLTPRQRAALERLRIEGTIVTRGGATTEDRSLNRVLHLLVKAGLASVHQSHEPETNQPLQEFRYSPEGDRRYQEAECLPAGGHRLAPGSLAQAPSEGEIRAHWDEQ